MAYWQRRPKGYVYVYTYESGRVKPLPRRMVKHLDGEPDHNIEAWVRQYADQFEGKKVQPDQILYDGSELSQLVKRYLAFLASRRKAMNTIKEHERMLMRYVIPFFLQNDPPLRDPQQWPSRSAHMLDWLERKGLTTSVTIACNKAIRGFYKFLVLEGRIQNGLQLRLLPPLVEAKSTPLQFAVSPDQVLAYVMTTQNEITKLVALTGYFFSLRPQELFALTKADFKAGSEVMKLESSKTMARYGLFNRLVVNVTKQKTGRSTIVTPKAGSSGWVNCFNEMAARILVEMLNGKEPDEPLFKVNNRRVFKHWHNDGLPEVTIKDLRRASLYWLGHSTAFQPLELMKHARHTSIETTMLYLRRPEEELVEMPVLDLDA